MTITVGYALGQLEKALAAAGGRADAAAGEHAAKKIARWQQVLSGMCSGSLAVGSRTPVEGATAWATLEVAQGGFATGSLLAGGPLAPHETDRLRGLDAPAGEERAALNLHYLGDAGRAELARMLSTGCYRVQVPEEGALLVVAWLLAHGHTDRAEEVIDAIVAFTGRLRFYPVPDAHPQVPSAVVKLRSAGETARVLEALRPRAPMARMNEALRVWAPLCDRAVSLFVETVEGEIPHLRTDAAGALVRRPDGHAFIDGGWPCKRYPPGWTDRAKALLFDCAAARARHPLCKKPDRPGETFPLLRDYLERCAKDAASLTGRDVGVIRKALASFVTRHGAPGSAEHTELRAAQALTAARPTHPEIARVLGARLDGYPEGAGLPSVDPVLAPISAAEHARFGIPTGTAVPASLARRLDRCLEAPIDELVRRKVIPSSEVLAVVLPQITSQVAAAGLADPDLARLYAAVYAAFRRRRSLLLVDLQSQVKLEELPWVAALAGLRTGKLTETDRARRTLEQVTTLAITSFPETILPNKLLQEMRALVKGADLALPLVDELAADIFMGAFSRKFLEAAKIAARVLQGSLYARYYTVTTETLLRIEAATTRSDGQVAAPSPEFAALCESRAEPDDRKGGSSVAQNGKIIEQEQILTTHNLAVLVDGLGLAPAVQAEATMLAQACFRFICRREQIKTDKFHARLTRVKNSAYAWRQMVFFLSLVDAGALEAFLAWADAHLGEQSEGFQRRFRPALRGLTVAAVGGDLDAAVRAGDARRFLGWSTGRHWLLTEG
jgi:hypothetical protein